MKQNAKRHPRVMGGSLLVIVIGLAVSLGGCGSASPNPASSTVLGPAVNVTPGASDGSPGASTTTGDETRYPVLTELPRISLDDLAVVDIRDQGAGAPSRVLSPVGDKQIVESLLEAYHRTVLKPAAGYPRSGGPHQIVFRLRDGSYVEVELSESKEPATVRHATKAPSSARGPVPAASAVLAEGLPSLTRGFTSGRLNTYDLASLGPTMPPQFGLIFAYGVGAKNVLDTFSGTYTKDLIVGPPATATANLRLTSAELAEIYRTLIEIDIQNYPLDFRPTDSTGTSVFVTPHQSYYLMIATQGIVAREVRWEDSSLSSSPKAKALRDLFTRIREMVEQKPEYQAMPQAQGGYL